MTDVSGPKDPAGPAGDPPEDDGTSPVGGERPPDDGLPDDGLSDNGPPDDGPPADGTPDDGLPDGDDQPTADAPEGDQAQEGAADRPPVLPDRTHERREEHAGPISIELSSQPGEGDAEGGGDGLDDEAFERPGGLLSRVDGHLLMYHQPRSLQAEQYRAFRANLVAMNATGAPWAIVVTSARKSEGKSVSAANLAACLAELPGSRVCLVDVDSREPSQAALLGCTPRAGVTEIVEGKASLNEALMVTLLPGLDCIHSGAEPANPAELLGGEPFRELIAALKRRYSWIVIDAPPVNPFTDPCVVAAQVDGAILVVRLMTAPKELVNSTMDAIRNAGGRVLGTFVTGLTPDTEHDAEASGYEGKPAIMRAMLADSLDLDRQLKSDKQLKKERRELLRRERAAWKKRKKAAKSDDEEHPV